MTELIDKVQLGPTQQAELYEGGKILITDDATDPFLQGVITLEAGPATLLFDFLLLHQDRLIRHRDAPAVSTAYQQAKPAIDAYVQSNPFVEDESHGEIDWKAIEAQSKIDLEAVETDAQAYAFIERYLSKDLRGRYMAIYRSDRHEMLRTPRQALDNLLSLPPLE